MTPWGGSVPCPAEPETTRWCCSANSTCWGEAAADALLGALEPAGNRAFRDRYVGLPLDLAGVLFVAAATNPGRIPPLLRERLELLPLAGYADAEKERIAASYLIPQRRGQHGLSGEDLSCSPAALRLLIDGYAREPGVRVLGHRIDALCRRAVRLRAEGLPLPRGDGSGDGSHVARGPTVPRRGDRRPQPPARRRGGSGRDPGGRRRGRRRGEPPPRLRLAARHRDGRGHDEGIGGRRPDVGPLARGSLPPRGCEVRRCDRRARARGRRGPFEGRPVCRRHLRRRPRLRAGRTPAAEQRGHDRRADARRNRRARRQHPGEGAGGVPGRDDGGDPAGGQQG